MPFTHKVSDPTAPQLKNFHNLILSSRCYENLVLFELPVLGLSFQKDLVSRMTKYVEYIEEVFGQFGPIQLRWIFAG